MFVILSGLGGALSWIFFYHALAGGPTVTVTVIDKLSIVFTAILAALVLVEGVTPKLLSAFCLWYLGHCSAIPLGNACWFFQIKISIDIYIKT